MPKFDMKEHEKRMLGKLTPKVATPLFERIREVARKRKLPRIK